MQTIVAYKPEFEEPSKYYVTHIFLGIMLIMLAILLLFFVVI
jgi:hypothetical protein